MCRMIGFASAEPADVTPYIAGLVNLSRRGNLLDRWEVRPGGKHPDGWGIAWRKEGEIRRLGSGMPAGSDPTLSEVAVATDRFIGHVRYASDPATVNASNAHPFFASGTALAHNGTFRGKIGAEAQRRHVSDTLVFLERLSASWVEKTFPRLREALSGILGDRGLVGDYSAANLLIATRDSLFALRNFRRDGGYYTLFLRTEPGLAVVASEPLDERPDWRLLDDGELVDLGPQAVHSTSLFASL